MGTHCLANAEIAGAAPIKTNVGVVISTYNAEGQWHALQSGLDRQGLESSQILIIDSSSSDSTRDLARQAGYHVVRVPREDCNQNTTQQRACGYMPDKQFLLFMSQDVVLHEEDSIDRLLESLDHENLGGAYGRQLDWASADINEAPGQMFTYPVTSQITALDRRETLRFESAYFPDSVTLYRPSALEGVGALQLEDASADVAVAIEMLLGYIKHRMYGVLGLQELSIGAVPPFTAPQHNLLSQMSNVRTPRVIKGHRLQQAVYRIASEADVMSDADLLELGDMVSHPINFPADSFKYRVAKRCIDLSIILLTLPLLIPAMFAIAILVKLNGSGSIFFSQPRVHSKHKSFRILKFRTMSANAEGILREHLANNLAARIEWRDSHKLRFDPRVSRIGAFLRRYSLDELPQVWNVVKGEMSLIGPRPISKAEIVKYGFHFACYCRVKPGLSGLWQVSGRNHTTYTQRVLFDCEYVRYWSLGLDLKILFRSISTVITGRGAF